MESEEGLNPSSDFLYIIALSEMISSRFSRLIAIEKRALRMQRSKKRTKSYPVFQQEKIWSLDLCQEKLDYANVNRREAFFTLLYIEADTVSFIERFETRCVYSGMMNKYIGSVFLLNEAIAFLIIKPLYYSICHNDTLLSFKNFLFTNLGLCHS